MKRLHPLQFLSALPFLLSFILLFTADPVFGKAVYVLGLALLLASAVHARMSTDIVELHPYAVCALLAGPWLLYSLAVTPYGLLFAFAALTTKEIWAGAYYRQRLWEQRGKRSTLPAKVNAYHAAAALLLAGYWWLRRRTDAVGFRVWESLAIIAVLSVLGMMYVLAPLGEYFHRF